MQMTLEDSEKSNRQQSFRFKTLFENSNKKTKFFYSFMRHTGDKKKNNAKKYDADNTRDKMFPHSATLYTVFAISARLDNNITIRNYYAIYLLFKNSRWTTKQ